MGENVYHNGASKGEKTLLIKCSILASLSFEDPVMTFEPFFIEQIPHLYESLQKFDFVVENSNKCKDIEFDLKKMKVFRNLKELKLDGKRVVYENIEQMVSGLEKSQYLLLELKLEPEWSLGWPSGWFRETMERISKAKTKASNLKIMIDLRPQID